MEPGDSIPLLQELSNNPTIPIHNRINPIPGIDTYLINIHSNIVITIYFGRKYIFHWGLFPLTHVEGSKDFCNFTVITINFNKCLIIKFNLLTLRKEFKTPLKSVAISHCQRVLQISSLDSILRKKIYIFFLENKKKCIYLCTLYIIYIYIYIYIYIERERERERSEFGVSKLDLAYT